LARSHTEIALKILAGIAKDGTNDAVRVAAACALLDRGWGKPAQPHTGEDGDGDIRVIVRHIVNGRDVIEPLDAKVIEARPRSLLANGDDEP